MYLYFSKCKVHLGINKTKTHDLDVKAKQRPDDKWTLDALRVPKPVGEAWRTCKLIKGDIFVLLRRAATHIGLLSLLVWTLLDWCKNTTRLTSRRFNAEFLQIILLSF